MNTEERTTMLKVFVNGMAKYILGEQVGYMYIADCEKSLEGSLTFDPAILQDEISKILSILPDEALITHVIKSAEEDTVTTDEKTTILRELVESMTKTIMGEGVGYMFVVVSGVDVVTNRVNIVGNVNLRMEILRDVLKPAIDKLVEQKSTAIPTNVTIM